MSKKDSWRVDDRRVASVADRGVAGWFSLWGGFKSGQSPHGQQGRGRSGEGSQYIDRHLLPFLAPPLPLPGPRLCDKKVTKSNFPAPADLLALLPH